jgi:starch synthase
VKQGKVETTLIAEDLEVNMGMLNHPFNLMAPATSGLPFYFVERDEFYERSQLYGTPRGDYFDNLERFAFFSGAVLPFCRALDFHPDLIHCHDWQSALVPVYLRHRWGGEDILVGTKTVLTIHNLAYQGLFPRDQYPWLGLDWSFFSIDGLEYYGQINLLKGGIISADAVTTVSPRYSVEIQTPEFGYGLDGVLRTRAAQLHGILNGVDYQDWNPGTDSLIPAPFSRQDLQGKAADKAALMAAFDLSPDLADAPLLAMISRLADQKGLDLLEQVLPRLMKHKLTLVILGTGDEKYQRWLEAEAPKYQGKLGVKVAFNNQLAHLIEAGADMFLMPSRYEPCGLNQIYSMKYGTIPVVRATGGLADTVTPVGHAAEPGTGFVFTDYTPEAFLKAIYTAMEAYADQDQWRQIMDHAMTQDFSWKVSARKYLELYKSLL